MGDRTKIADALMCPLGGTLPPDSVPRGHYWDGGFYHCPCGAIVEWVSDDRVAEHQDARVAAALPVLDAAGYDVVLRADPDTSDEPDWDRIFDRLPKVCPTCTSDEPTTYYGSCFDNQHSTIFDPRLPMDPWHAYMVELRHLLRQVDNLDTYVKIGREMLERAAAERDADVSAEAVARTVAMSHIAAERDAERAGRERVEAEARQLREAIEFTAAALDFEIDGDTFPRGVRDSLLGQLAVIDASVAEGAEDRGQS